MKEPVNTKTLLLAALVVLCFFGGVVAIAFSAKPTWEPSIPDAAVLRCECE